MTDGPRAPDPRSNPVRIFLRPLGSPLALGFFAFGTGMAVFGAVDVRWIPQAMQSQAGVLLISFVAPLELLAAVLAFLARDGMSGTSLGLFGGSWVTVGVQYLLGRPGQTSPVLTLYLFTFAIVVLLLGVVARTGQPLLGLILTIASIRTAVAGGYQLSSSTGLHLAAGALGFLLTVLAFYGGLAFLLEDTAHRTVLPLARRGQSRTSLEGSMGEQTEQLESEAGVRRSL